MLASVPSCRLRLSGRAGRSNSTSARQRCTVQSTNGWCIQLSLRLSVSKRGSEIISPRILHRLCISLPISWVGVGNTTTTETYKKYGEASYSSSHRSGQTVLSRGVNNYLSCRFRTQSEAYAGSEFVASIQLFVNRYWVNHCDLFVAYIIVGFYCIRWSFVKRLCK